MPQGYKTPIDVEKKIITLNLLGYSMPEISARTGVTKSTVFNILHRSEPDSTHREQSGDFVQNCINRNRAVKQYWDSIEIGQDVKITVAGDEKAKRPRIYIGEVVRKDDLNITILKSGTYRVSFKINDFISRTHKIQVIKLEVV